MTKSKRKAPDVEEVLARSWCYYCERDFDDDKILVAHQKAKHFKCARCGRRLNTAGGLSVHLNQVHKEQLVEIENTLPGREDPGIEIFAMEGIPVDIIEAHKQTVLEGYYRMEAERRAATGNPPPGAKGGGAKKPKIETPDELKARLAAHRASKEIQNTGTSSGGSTPMQGAVTPGVQPSPQGLPFPSVPAGMPQPFYGGPSPPTVFNPAFAPPPQTGFPPPSFSPQNGPSQPFALPSYPPPPFSPLNVPPHNVPPQGLPFHNQSPHSYQNGGMPTQVAPKQAAPPPRQNSLPSAPGLPQRPSFNSPAMSKEDMAKLHTGAHGPLPGNAPLPSHIANNTGFAQHSPNGSQSNRQEIGDSVDDLIASVTGQAAAKGESVPTPPQAQEPAPAKIDNLRTSENINDVAPSATPKAGTPAGKEEKKGKKPAKPTKMVYGDAETTVSPEEKLAVSPRYKFQREM